MSGGGTGAGRSARPAFSLGDDVTVRDLDLPGHVRTPHYVRRRPGRIVQYCGLYLNPEDLAVGRTDGPAVHLYRVVFEQSVLWPEDSQPDGDRLVTEIYEHWLEKAPGGEASEATEAGDGAA